ncbi:MAG: hypothetical protein VR70_04025 [Rhodospirillaceae bacterium BRH_c57]|nr:MAG: hypothetical protein VR70_04025 [Rhodospirillaceae bacterium BRH_c57]
MKAKMIVKSALGAALLATASMPALAVGLDGRVSDALATETVTALKNSGATARTAESRGEDVKRLAMLAVAHIGKNSTEEIAFDDQRKAGIGLDTSLGSDVWLSWLTEGKEKEVVSSVRVFRSDAGESCYSVQALSIIPGKKSHVGKSDAVVCPSGDGSLTTKNRGWRPALERVATAPDGTQWTPGLWMEARAIKEINGSYPTEAVHEQVAGGTAAEIMGPVLSAVPVYGSEISTAAHYAAAPTSLGEFEMVPLVRFGGRLNLPPGSNELHMMIEKPGSDDECSVSISATSLSGEKSRMQTADAGVRKTLPVSSGDDIEGFIFCSPDRNPRDHRAGEAPLSSFVKLEIASFPDSPLPRPLSIETPDFVRPVDAVPSGVAWDDAESGVAGLVSRGAAVRGLKAIHTKIPAAFQCKNGCNALAIGEEVGPEIGREAADGDFRTALHRRATLVVLEGNVALPAAEEATFLVGVRRTNSSSWSGVSDPEYIECRVDLAIDTYRLTKASEIEKITENIYSDKPFFAQTVEPGQKSGWTFQSQGWNVHASSAPLAGAVGQSKTAIYPIRGKVACEVATNGDARYGIAAEEGGILKENEGGIEVSLWVKADKDPTFRLVNGDIAFHAK